MGSLPVENLRFSDGELNTFGGMKHHPIPVREMTPFLLFTYISEENRTPDDLVFAFPISARPTLGS